MTSYTETDPVFSGSAASGISGTDVTNWDTAYGWGDHSAVGYMTSYTETDPVFEGSPAAGISSGAISNWNAAYGWGNHATAGYGDGHSLDAADGSPVNVMYVDDAGRVGIGTTSPSTKLQVESRTDNFASVRIGSDSDKDAALIFFTSTGDWNIGVDQSDSGKLKFGLNNWIPGNSPKVTIDTAGNFGIGTTDPGNDKLDVRGRAYAQGGWQTTDADYAEWFEKEGEAQPGDIIGINLDTGKARKYELGDRFLGICSSQSAFVGNRINETDEEMAKAHILVGLLGQMDFNNEQVIIEGRIVETTDGAEIGILLSNGKVFVGR